MTFYADKHELFDGDVLLYRRQSPSGQIHPVWQMRIKLRGQKGYVDSKLVSLRSTFLIEINLQKGCSKLCSARCSRSHFGYPLTEVLPEVPSPRRPEDHTLTWTTPYRRKGRLRGLPLTSSSSAPAQRYQSDNLPLALGAASVSRALISASRPRKASPL